MGWLKRFLRGNASEPTPAKDLAARLPEVSTAPATEESASAGERAGIDVGAMWERMLLQESGASSMEELTQRIGAMDESLRGSAIRSAAVDRKTCASCRALDGKVVVIDSPEFEEFKPPRHCTRGECRCEYVMSSEDADRLDGNGDTGDDQIR